ncbi:erythroid membrane-associated protein-like [Solea solea]|uniref:erythroid membrane-associated protein-like n=1 Tax=Solea solea TaxID=90069 RepID=UPI00272DA197|nr:erythroid membrane-associated protein-like [Solea solea]
MTSRFLGSLLLFSGFLPAPTGRPLQTDSPARFYALVGDDVTLPCLLPMPDVTLVNLVEWYRMDHQSLGSNQQTVLRAVRKGLVLVKDQDPQYRGRTDILANGSLELRNVMLRDYGNLNCKVLRLQSERDGEIAVVSLIQAKVSEINLTVHQSVVHCKSSGWSPEPLISLVNTTGDAFPAQKEPSVEEGGLFTVSVHLNITAFKGSETLTCRVEIPGSRVLREKTITVTIPVTVIAEEVDSLEEDFWNAVTFAMLGLGLTLSILFFLFVVYMRRSKTQVHMDILTMTTTGASEDTARNNKTFDEHGNLLIGVKASEQLARQDWEKIKDYWNDIISVGQLLRVHPALIAAIISRQSRGGTQLKPDGFGEFDSQCYGLMQINKTYHATEGGPYSSEHVKQGATFLTLLIKTMMRTKNWTREQQLKGALACYIAGTEKVIALDDPEEVDSVTPGGDFVNDVVARAQWFAHNGNMDADSAD